LLVLGVVAQSTAFTGAAALFGASGSVAFATFFVIVQQRSRAATATVGPRPLPAA
jgi:hypothetical protein